MIVTVEVELPFATTGPVPVIEELAADTELAINVSAWVTEVRPEGALIERVLASATVETI